MERIEEVTRYKHWFRCGMCPLESDRGYKVLLESGQNIIVCKRCLASLKRKEKRHG